MDEAQTALSLAGEPLTYGRRMTLIKTSRFILLKYNPLERAVTIFGQELISICESTPGTGLEFTGGI